MCSGRLKKRGGLRCRHSSKKGGLRCGSNSKKGGVLGAGQVKKGGSLPRHIPILNIYVSNPPPPPGFVLSFIHFVQKYFMFGAISQIVLS